jgi:hypothetical protein
MPAIQPARLRQQAALVVQSFAEPPVFIRSLHHLFEFYADRAKRPGMVGEPQPLLAAYHLRPPVLRQILLELTPLAQQSPQAALTLADALWEQPYVEFRTLAASLLGLVPALSPDLIFSRLETWIDLSTESQLVEALLEQGLARIRKEQMDFLLMKIADWLASPDGFHQRLGLRALLPIIADPAFDNLPISFRLITPFVRSAPSSVRPALLNVLAALAHRSPMETAFFLRESLTMSDSPDVPWMIRQSLHQFPSEIQQNLRAAMRSMD